MKSSRSSLILIFGVVFIHLVGFGIVIPVLPLYAERFGASALVIGLLLGVYSLMQAIFSPILGRLSDRVGRRPVLLLSLIGTAIGFLVMGLASTLFWLFVARIIDGATGGNISTAQAYIADITPPDKRSKGMGLIGAAFGLGFIFGPAIGGILGHFSLAAPFLFAAALSAVNAILVYFLLPESLPPERRGEAKRKPGLRAVIAESKGMALPLILATYFFLTVAFSLLTATYPLFAKHRFGLTPSRIGVIFSGLGFLSAIIQGGLLGRLVKLFSDRGLTVLGAILLAAGLFILPVFSTVGTMIIATAAVAIGHSLAAAPLNALASKSVGAASQGQVLGVMQSMASFARIVGPVLGGWLLDMDAAHPLTPFGRTPYWAGGLIMLFASALTVLLVRASFLEPGSNPQRT